MYRAKMLRVPYDRGLLRKYGTSLVSSTTILHVQNVYETNTTISPIDQFELEKGTLSSFTHDTCLQCLVSHIDSNSCCSLDQEWAIGWHCPRCGPLKQSKEMTTTFLSGALTNCLDPLNIEQYAVRNFQWTNEPDSRIDWICMMLACVAQKDGCNLREALGNANFFGKYTIFDTLARSWSTIRDCSYTAVRIQGVILLCPVRKRSLEGEERKKELRTSILSQSSRDSREVFQLRMTRSELSTSDGKSINFSVFNKCRVTTDGEPIIYRKPIKWNFVEHKFAMSRVMDCLLTGGTKISEGEFGDESSVLTKDSCLAAVDAYDMQRCWDCLIQTLTFIQEFMPTDGEYCTITMNPIKMRGELGRIVCENKGPVDPNWFHKDFAKAFGL